MQKTKRILNLIALIVFLMSNFLTPISYATSDLSISGVEGNESDGSYVGTEQGTQDFLASTSEGQTGEALEGQEDEQNDDSVSSGTEGNGSEEFSNDSETPIDSSSNPKNDDNDGNIVEPEPRDEVIENSSLDLLKDTIDNISTNPDDNTEPTQIPENNEYEESEIGDVIKNSENDIPESENDETVGIESEEIYGTGEYEGVKVEVYAQAGLFDKGTELTIEPVVEEKLEAVQEVLLSGEINLAKEQVIAFDITFRNPATQEELQPKNGTVQVKFNYEENESLVQAEENEEQEVKVYHLNDIDEEGNKIEELTGTVVEEVTINKVESEEENVMVVEAENFSVYTIVVQVREQQLINFQYGMISIANPSNSNQGITIMDRNLGATMTGGYTNAPVESYGYHYQWGNNYGFDSQLPSSSIQYYSSSTQYYSPTVNVSSYDEYYSNKFVKNDNWMSTRKNLWPEKSQGPCPEGWHIPTRNERNTLRSYYNSWYGTSLEGFMQYFNIPFAGYRDTNGNPSAFDSRVEFWTSSYSNSNRVYVFGWYSSYSSTSNISTNGTRRPGMASSIRCFKDSYEGSNNNLHTITFDFRGGKGSTASINVKHGSKGQEPSAPTRPSSTFLGWYLSGTDIEFNFTGTTITENKYLYAKWSCNNGLAENEKGDGCSGTVLYNFDANGGFFGGDETNTVQTLQYSYDGSDYYTIDNLKNPQRVSKDISQQSGWMFDGWYMKSGIDDDWGEEFNPLKATTTTVYAKWLQFNDISIMDGDQVGFTIMDRNLGAVSTSYGSNLDGIGYYYQWGNNYGFSSNPDATIKTSSESVDASGYGPDNYYSSNIFIKSDSPVWDSSNNKNLWGGTGDSLKTRGAGTDEDRQGPCPVGYHIPSILERKFAYNVRYNSSERSTDENSDLKNFIKDFQLPFAGNRSYSNGNVSNQGTYGYYLSSSPLPNSVNVYTLYMYNGGSFSTQYGSYPSYGYSIRCFKNLSGTKKIQYFTETGEKIREYNLDWWDSIPDINVERTGYEFLGWYESGSNEAFDFTEYIARNVSLYERWINIEGITGTDTAKLLNGKKFNSAIKTLASGAVIAYDDFDNQIKGIERSENLPEGINKKLISSADSESPIFAWYDTESQKIKYYTKAREVYMNEDSSYMYSKFKNLSSINLEEFKADYVENMDWMFYYSYSSIDGLNLDFRNLNLSNVTSMANMFNYFCYQGSGAHNVTINFSKMNLSTVENINNMFYYSFAYTKNITGVEINFSEADMSSVTNMSSMFYYFGYSYGIGGDINGVTVNFSKADMRSVTNMSSIFNGFLYTKNITGVEINFSEADMRSVTNMQSMFYYFGYGYNSSDINGVTVNFSKADMRSVTNMSSMFNYTFAYTHSITGIEINFSEADMRSVTNMSSMFYYFGYSYSIGGDISGVTVNFSKVDMSSVTDMSQMFQYTFAYADSITGIEINFSEKNMSNVQNMSQMFYYFCCGNNNNQGGVNINGVTVNFSKADMRSVTNMSSMFQYAFKYVKSATGVVIDFSEADMSSVTSMNRVFAGFGYGNNSSDISGVTVNFSKADMSSVTDMSYMFNEAFAYVKSATGVVIDFSEADMSSVTTMYDMFYYNFAYAKSLTGVIIDFSEADMSSVTNMSSMFYDLGAYGWGNINGVTVDFSKADMNSVTNMSYMFYYNFTYAKSVTGVVIDFSEADMSSVTNMSYMFYYFCYGDNPITDQIDIKWNNSKFTSSLTNMYYMFYSTFGITGLDLSSFDTSNVTNMYYMFYKTRNLKTIYVGSKFKTNNVTSSSSMFYDAKSLVGGRGTTYNSSNPNDKTYARVDRIGEPGYFTQKGGSSVATATLLPGQEFNAKIKTISKGSSASYSDADTYIKKIKKGTEEQALARISGGGTLEKISSTTSEAPVFARYNNSDKTLYYYSEANEIDMNANAYGMFYNLTKLEEVELNGINTSSVTSMGSMFKYDTSLTGLDLSSFDTSNVTSMTNMFEGCSNLKTLILDGWNLSKSPSISTMFYNATSLEKVSMRGWKLPTSFIHMLGCRTSQLCATTLQELDVTNWDLSQTTDISGLFGQSNTRQIIGLDTWNTSNIENMNNMFGLCPNLTSLNLDNWNLSKLNITSSNSSAIGGMYSGTPNLKTLSMKNRVLPASAYQLAGGWSNSLSAELDWIDVSGWDLSKTTDLNGLFGGNQTKKIIGMDTWNTSNIQNMNNMFYGCKNLTGLNLSGWNTSNVEDMSAMFYGNSSLTELNLSGWNTSKVQNMSAMFYGDNKLKTLDVSHFNTSNVTNMANMFEGCSKLKTLDVSHFNTSKVSDMSSMFRNCTSLTGLNLDNFNTSAATNMQSMFGGCNKLTKLDLSNFNTSQVSNMSYMFQNCSSLKDLNVSTFNTSNVTDVSGMFKNCSSLTGLDLSNLNTSQVSNMNSMFQNCASLKELNISSWDTNNVTNMASMFDGDSKLTTVYASNKFVTNRASNSTMFQDTYDIRGGKGTTYDISELGTKYAKIDEKGSPGYFTDILDTEYEITYDTNGGTITGEKATYTAKESFDLVTPSREGYSFVGWIGSNGNDPEIQVTIQTGTTGELYFIANWSINTYKIIFDTDGGNDIPFIEREYKSSLADISLPSPTKEGYTFLGWNRTLPATMPGEDITFVAQWESVNKPSSSGGGGGGGGGSSAIDVVKESVDSNTDTHKAAEGKDEVEEKTTLDGNTSEDKEGVSEDDVKESTDSSNTETSESTYSEEFTEAYSFAKSNGITTKSTIQEAKMNSTLTRIQMAKMLSYYAINVFGQDPDMTQTIKFEDVSDKRDAEYDNGVTLAYQLGIMGINMKNNKFRPDDEVTRAEFVTALSRMIYGMKDGTGKMKYYEPHMTRMYNEGIISNTNPNMKEKRGYVMIMLMRTVK